MPEVTRFPYFADNQWHQPAGGQWIDSENPADGRVWAQVPDCGEADVDRAVQAAKAAFYDGPWGRMLPAQRGRVLRRIGDLISEKADELGEVELRDNGRTGSIAGPGKRLAGRQLALLRRPLRQVRRPGDPRRNARHAQLRELGALRRGGAVPAVERPDRDADLEAVCGTGGGQRR